VSGDAPLPGTFAALEARYRVPFGGINAGERVAPLRLWPAFDLYRRVGKLIRIALLRQRFVQMASRLGARTTEIRVAATPARAIAVTLQVSDPAPSSSTALFVSSTSSSSPRCRFSASTSAFVISPDNLFGRRSRRLPNEGCVRGHVT
jgi:hypothetical protein